MRLPFNFFGIMEIFVIRHTQVAVKNTCYGQSNVPLAATFAAEVAMYKNELPDKFDAVFCSPSERCRKLSNALNFDNVIFENALMEMNFGDWEGKKWNDIEQTKLDLWMKDFVNERPPNGENLLELFDRIKLFLDNLRQQKFDKILLITHAGVIRCIWAYLLEIPLQNIFKLTVGHNEILVCNLMSDKAFDRITMIRTKNK
jgi:alpha-ribazole phosphatase